MDFRDGEVTAGQPLAQIAFLPIQSHLDIARSTPQRLRTERAYLAGFGARASDRHEPNQNRSQPSFFAPTHEARTLTRATGLARKSAFSSSQAGRANVACWKIAGYFQPLHASCSLLAN
jgi:hypothetical protein